MGMTIELTDKYKGEDSTTFSGRPVGRKARTELGLDKLDRSSEVITIIIPVNTTSINPSFYLGMFYKSIKNLKGLNNFKNKYIIQFLESDEEVIRNLKANIRECERQALNEYADS